MLPDNQRKVLNLTTEAAIRIVLLAIVVLACARIVAPLAIPVVWGTVLAVVARPLVEKLARLLGGRRRWACVLFTLAALALLLVPCWLLAEAVVRDIAGVGAAFAHGEYVIPAPPDGVADWPLIGGRLEAAWSRAHADPPALIEAMGPHLQDAGRHLVHLLAGLAGGVLIFAFSIIVAGLLIGMAESGTRAIDALARRLAGDEQGPELVRIAAHTVTSVVKGLFGVGVIRGILATVGMLVAGVPGAGAWGLLVTLMAVLQLPIALVLLPMAIYMFSQLSTFGGFLFLAWVALVLFSDDVLKPLLLGRGVEVPMPVILIGAIGGMLAWGVIGLFVGAVVLAVGWQLLRVWYAAPAAPDSE